MNYSGHYLVGQLYDKDEITHVCDFHYALIRGKSVGRSTSLQGVASNVQTRQIEVVDKTGLFRREMHVSINGTKSMIENVSETPINALYGNSLSFIVLDIKI